MNITFKNSVYTSQKTHCFSITKKTNEYGLGKQSLFIVRIKTKERMSVKEDRT